MRSAALTLGRRFCVVLEPGEELVATVAQWARSAGVQSATVDVVFGAFRDVTLIATRGELADPEPPLAARETVAYVEGLGSGTITTVDGVPVPHLHLAVGAKDQGGSAYAGHVIAATTQYTVELVVQEVLSPRFVVRPEPRAFGLGALHFDG